MGSLFDSSEPLEKRAILAFLLQNPTVNGKTLGFTLRSPFNMVLELANNPIQLREQDSNLRPIAYTLSIVTNGVDYITTIVMKTLGASVSSLYGAPN